MEFQEIDRYCDLFEQRLKAGQRNSIEQFLEEHQLPRDETLLEELAKLWREYLPDDAPATEREATRDDAADGVEAIPETDTLSEAPGTVIGNYKLLQEIGAGGMGVVYMAEQLAPVRRQVALKVIKPGMDSRQVIARFEAERQALAMMEHPNVAKVLGAGTTDSGRPFFVMELVRGVPITEYCDEHRLTVGERLELFVSVCQAIQHAHQKGIVHRDIKPSNVLVCNYDGRPVPKVIDFGVAKAVRQQLTEKTVFTQFGQVMGTLEYMSPEQAGLSQLDIDTRSDIYSLGVLLYELLTGSTPITKERLGAAAFEEVLRLIREEDPPKPSARLSGSGDALPPISAQRRVEPKKLGALVRGDLDWIVLRALDKDRSMRYQTANALVRDVQRHLDEEAVEACPPSASYKLRKFARKHRTGISIAALFVGLLILGVVISSVQAGRERWYRNLAEANAAEAQTATIEANRQAGEASIQAGVARRANEQTQKALYEMTTSLGLREGGPAALLWFAEAAKMSRAGSREQRVNRVRVRAWSRQVPTPIRALWHDGEKLETFAFDPTGQYIATLTTRGNCTVWGVFNERKLRLPDPTASLAWSPDGTNIAVGLQAGGVQIFDLQNASFESRSQIDFDGTVTALAYSFDGNTIAIGSRIVRTWDFAKKEFVSPAWEHPAEVRTLNFSSDDRLLVTGCEDDQARVFDAHSSSDEPRCGPVRCRLRMFSDQPPIPPQFVDKGRGLILPDAAAAGWLVLESNKVNQIRSSGPGFDFLANSPDGRHFVLGGHHDMQVWDAVAGKLVERTPSCGVALSGSISPDGTWLITGDLVGLVRRWSIPDVQPFGPTIPHSGRIRKVECSPTGRHFATGTEDGLVRVWLANDLNPRSQTIPLDGKHTDIKLSRDGNSALLTGASWWWGDFRFARLISTCDLKIAEAFMPDTLLMDACISADNRHVAMASIAASASEKPKLAVFDRETREVTGSAFLDAEPRAVEFSPDGELIIVVCAGGVIQVADAVSADAVGQCRHGMGPLPNFSRDFTKNRYWQSVDRRRAGGTNVEVENKYLRFSPDGRWFITSAIDDNVYVWDVKTRRPRYEPLDHGDFVNSAELSTDAELLITATAGGAARVWRFDNGEPIGRELMHPQSVTFARFSPDGRHALTGCRDGKVRLWDWRSGELICRPMEHKQRVVAGDFLEDGAWIISAGNDETLRLWDPLSGTAVCPPFHLNGLGWRMVVPPDGSRVLVTLGSVYERNARQSSLIDVIPLNDLQRDDTLATDDLVLFAEVASGQRVEAAGVVTMTSEEWLERWRRFKTRQSGYIAADWNESDVHEWHLRQTRAFSKGADRRFSFGWHLDHLSRHDVNAAATPVMHAVDAPLHHRIIVDASRDGGVWWAPQYVNFDPTMAHQGKRLVDHLRSRGWEVESITRQEDVSLRLQSADIVIRANCFGEYQPLEVLAYREYVKNGGTVLMLQGYVRDGDFDDAVAQEFGIQFSGIERSPTIQRWAEHDLTNDLELLPYETGSVVTKAPESTVPLAYLGNDKLVAGQFEYGKGRVVFISTILPLLREPHPIIDRIIDEVSRKD